MIKSGNKIVLPPGLQFNPINFQNRAIDPTSKTAASHFNKGVPGLARLPIGIRPPGLYRLTALPAILASASEGDGISSPPSIPPGAPSAPGGKGKPPPKNKNRARATIQVGSKQIDPLSQKILYHGCYMQLGPTYLLINTERYTYEGYVSCNIAAWYNQRKKIHAQRYNDALDYLVSQGVPYSVLIKFVILVNIDKTQIDDKLMRVTKYSEIGLEDYILEEFSRRIPDAPLMSKSYGENPKFRDDYEAYLGGVGSAFKLMERINEYCTGSWEIPVVTGDNISISDIVLTPSDALSLFESAVSEALNIYENKNRAAKAKSSRLLKTKRDGVLENTIAANGNAKAWLDDPMVPIELKEKMAVAYIATNSFYSTGALYFFVSGKCHDLNIANQKVAIDKIYSREVIPRMAVVKKDRDEVGLFAANPIPQIWKVLSFKEIYEINRRALLSPEISYSLYRRFERYRDDAAAGCRALKKEFASSPAARAVNEYVHDDAEDILPRFMILDAWTQLVSRDSSFIFEMKRLIELKVSREDRNSAIKEFYFQQVPYAAELLSRFQVEEREAFEPKGVADRILRTENSEDDALRSWEQFIDGTPEQYKTTIMNLMRDAMVETGNDPNLYLSWMYWWVNDRVQDDWSLVDGYLGGAYETPKDLVEALQDRTFPPGEWSPIRRKNILRVESGIKLNREIWNTFEDATSFLTRSQWTSMIARMDELIAEADRSYVVWFNRDENEIPYCVTQKKAMTRSESFGAAMLALSDLVGGKMGTETARLMRPVVRMVLDDSYDLYSLLVIATQLSLHDWKNVDGIVQMMNEYIVSRRLHGAILDFILRLNFPIELNYARGVAAEYSEIDHYLEDGRHVTIIRSKSTDQKRSGDLLIDLDSDDGFGSARRAVVEIKSRQTFQGRLNVDELTIAVMDAADQIRSTLERVNHGTVGIVALYIVNPSFGEEEEIVDHVRSLLKVGEYESASCLAAVDVVFAVTTGDDLDVTARHRLFGPAMS